MIAKPAQAAGLPDRDSGTYTYDSTIGCYNYKGDGGWSWLYIATPSGYTYVTHSWNNNWVYDICNGGILVDSDHSVTNDVNVVKYDK
jgi:hypothetical protein